MSVFSNRLYRSDEFRHPAASNGLLWEHRFRYERSVVRVRMCSAFTPILYLLCSIQSSVMTTESTFEKPFPQYFHSSHNKESSWGVSRRWTCQVIPRPLFNSVVNYLFFFFWQELATCTRLGLAESRLPTSCFFKINFNILSSYRVEWGKGQHLSVDLVFLRYFLEENQTRFLGFLPIQGMFTIKR